MNLKILSTVFEKLEHSPHWRILKNMFLVSMFLGLGKLAGAGKEVAVAYRYGTSEFADLFGLAQSVVTWLPTVWMAVSVSVLVPLTHKLSTSQRLLFHRELNACLLIVGALLALLTYWFMPALVRIASPDFAQQHSTEFERLAFVVSLAVPFIVVTSLFNAQLLAVERHSNTLLNGIPSLVLLLTLLAFPYFHNTDALSAGFLMGAIIHVLVLYYLVRSVEFFGKPKFSMQSEGWKGFLDALSIMMFSNFIISIAPIVDQILASKLATGSIATLGYSVRLTALFVGLGATAVSRAILPILSKSDSYSLRRSITARWFGLLFIGGIIFSLVAWIATPMLVSLMFERGAFTAEDSVRVSNTLRYGLSQIPFYFAGIVLVQYFASQRKYWVLFGSSCVALLVKLLFGWWLAQELGTRGITLSTGIMYVSTFSYLIIMFLRDSETKERVA